MLKTRAPGAVGHGCRGTAGTRAAAAAARGCCGGDAEEERGC